MGRFLQRAIAVPSCVFVLGLGMAAAQSVSISQVSGVVVDSSGATLPGVSVTMKKTDTGQTRSVVTGGDGGLSLFVGRHFDEAEPTCAARRHVAHDADGFNRAGLREQRFEFTFGGVVGEVADVQFATHDFLTPAFHPWECCPGRAL